MMKMTDLGKFLIIAGLVLVVGGFVLVGLGRANFPLGRLPGDMVYRGKSTTFYFPLATSLLVSVVLSIVLYVVGRWRR
jgi:H+/Cl- antiporter ClcA